MTNEHEVREREPNAALKTAMGAYYKRIPWNAVRTFRIRKTIYYASREHYCRRSTPSYSDWWNKRRRKSAFNADVNERS